MQTIIDCRSKKAKERSAAAGVLCIFRVSDLSHAIKLSPPPHSESALLEFLLHFN